MKSLQNCKLISHDHNLILSSNKIQLIIYFLQVIILYRDRTSVGRFAELNVVIAEYGTELIFAAGVAGCVGVVVVATSFAFGGNADIPMPSKFSGTKDGWKNK